MSKPWKYTSIKIIALFAIFTALAITAGWFFNVAAVQYLLTNTLIIKLSLPILLVISGAILLYCYTVLNKNSLSGFQNSEDKYQSLIEQASDIIYILDLNGNFTDVNASMCKIMGYTREEMLQLNIKSILDPDELKTDPLPDKMDKSTIPIVRERHFIRKDGKIFTAEINVKKFTDDCIMVIARDTTYRKKMESDLREAEVKFRTIAEKSMIGIYIAQNGRYIYVNPRFAQIFGYTPAEMIDTFPVETVVDESYRDLVNENVRRRIAGEIDSIHYEAKGIRKDGTSNWLELYGSRAIIGGETVIMGSALDITERKKNEIELRSSEQEYKLLFDSNPMPMWMIGKDDQRIIAVNDAGAKHYGYRKEELLHMDVKIFRPREDRKQQLLDYRQDKNADSPRVVKHLKKDGTIIYVQIIAHDIIFEGRQVRLSMTNDITEKLKAEQDLKNAYESIRTHISSIKEMAWKQSHLIRGPLANLQGLVPMLKDDPKNAELFNYMQNELNRMDTIIIEMAEEASDHD